MVGQARAKGQDGDVRAEPSVPERVDRAHTRAAGLAGAQWQPGIAVELLEHHFDLVGCAGRATKDRSEQDRGLRMGSLVQAKRGFRSVGPGHGQSRSNSLDVKLVVVGPKTHWSRCADEFAVEDLQTLRVALI